VTRLGLGLGSSSDRLLVKPGSIRISCRRQSEDDPRKRAGTGYADLRLAIQNPKSKIQSVLPFPKGEGQPEAEDQQQHQPPEITEFAGGELGEGEGEGAGEEKEKPESEVGSFARRAEDRRAGRADDRRVGTSEDRRSEIEM
jgi:hypothetical protein